MLRRVKRVLIVDDDQSVAVALATMLADLQVASEIMSAGALAPLAVALYKPDLVILDIGLPDVDGRRVCRRIRETSDVPIALTSGHISAARKMPAATVFLQKPYSLEDLDRALGPLGLTFSTQMDAAGRRDSVREPDRP